MTDTYKYVVRVETDGDTNATEMQEVVRDALSNVYDTDTVKRVAIADRNGMYDEDTKKVVEIIETLETRHVTNAIEFVREQHDG